MQPKCNQRGSTLIEIVVVAFIVMIALTVLANLTVVSLGRNRQAKELAVGTRLAQEGLEWFKAQRNLLGYEQFSTYAISISGSNCLVNEAGGMDTGFAQVSNPETEADCAVSGNYHRWYEVTYNPSYVGVTVYVAAPGKSALEAIKVEGKLYRWQR